MRMRCLTSRCSSEMHRRLLAVRDDDLPVPHGVGEIELVADQVGIDKIDVRTSPAAIRKRQDDVCLDLSGIAKGYAVDRIAEHLEDRGIQRYMVGRVKPVIPMAACAFCDGKMCS